MEVGARKKKNRKTKEKERKTGDVKGPLYSTQCSYMQVGSVRARAGEFQSIRTTHSLKQEWFPLPSLPLSLSTPLSLSSSLPPSLPPSLHLSLPLSLSLSLSLSSLLFLFLFLFLFLSLFSPPPPPPRVPRTASNKEQCEHHRCFGSGRPTDSPQRCHL